MAEIPDMTHEMTQFHQEMSEFHQEMRESFHLLLGLEILTWLTSLGLLLTVLFRQ